MRAPHCALGAQEYPERLFRPSHRRSLPDLDFGVTEGLATTQSKPAVGLFLVEMMPARYQNLSIPGT